MASVVTWLSETLGALGNQPADALNDGVGTIDGVTVVGKAIVSHHAPSAHKQAPRTMHTQHAPVLPPEPAHNVTEPVDVIVEIGPVPSRTWEQIIAERARKLEPTVFPTQPVDAWFAAHMVDAAHMNEWHEWHAVQAEIAAFFDYATQRAPDPERAEKYVAGQIGSAIRVPIRLVRTETAAAWVKARTISRTHTGSLEFLTTFDASIPVVKTFAQWLRVIVTDYHLLVRVVPYGAPDADPWDDDASIVARLKIYYTGMTLAHLYALSAVVSARARPSILVEPDTSLSEMAHSALDQYATDSRKTYVFSMDDDEHSVPEAAAVKADWQTILGIEAAHAFTYENARRERFGMWTQMHRGDPGPVLYAVSVAHDTRAIDMHFTAHMHSPYLPHREFPLAFPLETMPLASAPLPVCAPLEPFGAEFETASIATGTEATRYSVREGALMNVKYQFAAPAWASASYVLPDAALGGTKKMLLVDVQLHVFEPALAVFMAQSLAHMATARAAEVDGPADDDDDYNVLLTRAILFHNVCE